MNFVRPTICYGLIGFLEATSLASQASQNDDRIGVKKDIPPTEEWIDPFTYPNGSRKVPPSSYKDGPMPTISDSLFSLIILIYVGVIFVFMFFAFCWKEPEPPPPDPKHANIPMITEMLADMEEMEKAEAEAKAAAAAEAAQSDLEGQNGNGGQEGTYAYSSPTTRAVALAGRTPRSLVSSSSSNGG